MTGETVPAVAGWLFGVGAALSLVGQYVAGDLGFLAFWSGLAAANGLTLFLLAFDGPAEVVGA